MKRLPEARARKLVHDRFFILELPRGLIRIRALRVDAVTADLTFASGRQPEAAVAWSAGRLVVIAARLLPPVDRERYAVEFRGELYGLAKAGVGRWRQLRHAVRLLVRVPSQRVELMAARRRGVAP